MAGLQKGMRSRRVLDAAVPAGLDLHLVLDDYLRRSARRGVTELENGIRKWITGWNKDPKPFAWAKTADETLAACRGLIRDSARYPASGCSAVTGGF